ncbi:MAG TPA: hypothetical protein VFJ94_16185 [Intrasporangium sp.]|uniref:hypothetical protein n=1 Tax=Intrasporangium sp. TaxID=1925024 RepID=UPI002D77A025|nr:hypothetical protein [Intrasporangium sp.]HET7400056.1 hypothetical protein [Intrasporangium sp.]
MVGRSLRGAAVGLVVAGLAGALLGACGEAPVNSSASPSAAPVPPAAGTGAGRDAGGGNPFTGGQRYEPAGPLPEPATQGPVLRVAALRDADLVRIARAFGMTAAVRDEGGLRVVSDGRRRLTAAGSLWTVSALHPTPREQTAVGGCLPSTDRPAADAPAVGCDAGPTPTSGTALPPPDPGVAERRARRVLADAGLDLRGAQARTTVTGSQWTVVLRRQVQGLPVVAGDFVVSTDARGLLVGRGFATDTVALGPHRLVGVASGLRQLDDGLVLGDVPAASTATPAPVLRVTGVTLSLALIQSAATQLVPAYTFRLADGTTRTTPAVPTT